MIRAVWVLVTATVATLALGSLVFLASFLGVRGRIYDWIARRWAGAVLRSSGARLDVQGLDRVNWDEPQVVVCNHVSAFDILALATTIPVTYRFVAKKELERVPMFGPAWKAAGHISIDRENRERAIESLRRAGEKLRREGGAVVIFPEGTRSDTGELQPFKKGAFRLAVEAQVPILPAAVVDSDKVTPARRLHVTKAAFRLIYGNPIPTMGMGPEDVDRLIEMVREQMLRLMREGRAVDARPL